MGTISVERIDPPSTSVFQVNVCPQSLNSTYYYDRRQFRHELADGEQVYNDGDDAETHDTVDGDQDNQELEEKIKLCGVCHSTVRYTGIDQPALCYQNHTRCQRCVEHYAIQSETGCVSSRNESHLSRSTRFSTSPDGRRVEHCKIDPYENRRIQMLSNGGDMKGHCSQRRFRVAQQVHRDFNIDWDRPQSNYVNYIKYQRFNDCNQMRNDSNESIISETRINTGMTVAYSRRPIRCPRIDCAVNIAFSALTHHFLFDHPEVPIVCVEPGALSTLTTTFADFSCDSSHCLAVLLVSGKLTGSVAKPFNGNQIHPQYRDRLPLPVLAALLHCPRIYTTHDDPNTKDEGNDKGNIIITWIAGLDIINVGGLHCTIQAVDSLVGDGMRTLSYRGPINSLRTAQRPKEVFSTGDCLILHEGLLHHLTTTSATLNINVIVH